jgi:hypothetical protein
LTVNRIPICSKLKGQVEFRYDIPLTQGTRELRLHFAETEYGPGNALGGGEAARLFNILINGVEVVKWFDPLAEAGGPNRLVVRVFKDIAPAVDGKLHIAFRPTFSLGRIASPAFLNAIEILQSKPVLYTQFASSHRIGRLLIWMAALGPRTSTFSEEPVSFAATQS